MAADPNQPPESSRLSRLGYGGPLYGVDALRWQAGEVVSRQEQLIEEVPVVLVYNQLPHVVMMATPADLEDFAVGFSVTEELVRSPADVLGIDVVRYSRGIELQIRVPAECQTVIESRSRRLTGRTGCGICGSDSIDAVLKSARRVEPAPPVAPDAIRRAVASIGASQRLNDAAGAAHAAAWAGRDGVTTIVREDVGRHNALDKLIGACLRTAVDPRSGFVVVTSRASFEMVQKAAVLGASLVVAISGPTALAVRLADEAGIGLVGFAREGRFTAYAHPERIGS